jgi:hypothetical protein
MLQLRSEKLTDFRPRAPDGLGRHLFNASADAWAYKRLVRNLIPTRGDLIGCASFDEKTEPVLDYQVWVAGFGDGRHVLQHWQTLVP